ncbi:NAD(P)H-dependent oxidoreductase [Ornithinibacillus sp. BX22]|uniref:NAD(P)H-dependent oxidoreductase n=2 Tax=Ornithinibacillus TaxID=484508 RepID=A0A923RI92_9BACI|nr:MULTISPECIES: NADPH-dependent FMN reductase [Ornithinibacillus]MBC5637011.1 NAD(P)H-dependent oxidoreductase [Ornithinibacillus hominis]MBS3679779.1 NAD(P)H-dependent oxidoreductase [Ornithinibacillus massiliensis]
MNVVTLVGSIRKESLNMKIAKFMQDRYKDKFDMQILNIDILPFYNQDDENNPPQVVKDFKREIANADAVIIVTPEYNWSIPGVLKNALDWASRVEKVLVNKPVFPLGASQGVLGTIRAQLHLRDILSSTGIQARILPPGGNEVLINLAGQKVDVETDMLTDQTTIEFLDSKIDTFIEFINS